MATFDFITIKEFRSSLEADYTEMCCCLDAKAWKAVHVLAGSIIEALLLDTLQSTGFVPTGKKALLEMYLPDIIAASVAEGVLSRKASELSIIVTNYRNLIHPGRVVRLGEVVDGNGAKVASSLVEIIVDEVAAIKRKTYGYTAEQILKKVESDSSVSHIITQIMREAKPAEIDRLLTDVLRQRIFELSDELMWHPSTAANRKTRESLTLCFRTAFALATDDVRRRALKNFGTILREESEPIVLAYEGIYFRGADIEFACPDDATLIKRHLIGRLNLRVESDLLTALSGIGKHLNQEEIDDFIGPIAKTLPHAKSDIYRALQQFAIAEYNSMPKHLASEVYESVSDWASAYRQNGYTEAAGILQWLKQQLNFDPFDDDNVEADPYVDHWSNPFGDD